MKSGKNFSVVLVTAPDLKTARSLAKAAIAGRLAACVNVVPGIESHYRWKGRIESAGEVLMVMKTMQGCLGALEKMILEKHPYETAEFIVLPLQSGSKRYLEWMDECCKRVE